MKTEEGEKKDERVTEHEGRAQKRGVKPESRLRHWTRMRGKEARGTISIMLVTQDLEQEKRFKGKKSAKGKFGKRRTVGEGVFRSFQVGKPELGGKVGEVFLLRSSQGTGWKARKKLMLQVESEENPNLLGRPEVSQKKGEKRKGSGKKERGGEELLGGVTGVAPEMEVL